MTFEEQIKQELEKLNRKQQIEFTWRCAVRVLPFLGFYRSFNFWKAEKRQTRLYAMFRALDVAIAFRTSAATYAATSACANVDAAATAGEYASFGINMSYLAGQLNTDIVGAAAQLGCSAGATNDGIDGIVEYASKYSGVEDLKKSNVFDEDDSSVDTYALAQTPILAPWLAGFASCAFAIYAADEFDIEFISYLYDCKDISECAEGAVLFITLFTKKLNVNLISVLLSDIESIQNDRLPTISIDIYGKFWDNFQQALKNEGCEYWGKLYQNIFENNFKVDVEALERRIKVPIEIQEKGAAMVGKYLER